MSSSLQPQRVRLTADLTRYDARLTTGQLGWTEPGSHAVWGVIVRYDCGARLDTLPRSLEVLEEETRELAKQNDLNALEILTNRLQREHHMTAADIRKHIRQLRRARQVKPSVSDKADAVLSAG
jgi:hypothetical protein